MSNIKISQLPQAQPVTGDEPLPIVQDGETVRTTIQNVADLATLNIAVGTGLTIDNTNPRNPIIAIGYIAQDVNNLSNNIAADATSTIKYPSVSAIKTYADSLVVGLVDDRGNFTPSPTNPGAYPTDANNGSGIGGTPMTGDIWFIDTIGYLGTTLVQVGASVRALVDDPSPTTDSDWGVLDAGLGYIPENSLNKSDDGTFNSGTPSHILFPTQYAVATYVTANTSKTLQAVLNAGNTADNQSITLYNTGHSLSSRVRYDENLMSSTSGATLATDADKLRAYNSITTNIVEANNASDPYVKVYRGSTNKYTSLFSDSLKYSNSGFLGRLGSSNLTASQTWTLPNNTGTIALTSDILPTTLQQVTSGANKDLIDSINLQGINAGASQSGHNVNLFGESAGSGNTMNNLNALGSFAALGNSGSNVNALGFHAAYGNTYSDINAFGRNAYADHNNQTIFSKDGGLQLARLSYTNLTANRKYELPDNDGTIALLSDIANTSSWSLAGNAGTIAGTNFIGTTDVQDLVFKAANAEVFRAKAAGGITSLGSIMINSSIGNPRRLRVINNANSSQLSEIGVNTVGIGYLKLGNGTGDSMIQSTNLITTGITIELPNVSGTLVLSVNGIPPNNAGEITLPIPPVTLQAATAGTNKNLTNGRNLQGTGAGDGVFAGVDVNAFGANAANSNLGTSVNAFGNNAARSNSGYNVNAIGASAAQGNSNSQVNAIGQQAAYQNNGVNVNAIGYQVAYQNYGQAVNAMGYAAAKSNLGSDTNAFGTNAALSNQGQYVNAIGNQAAGSNLANHVNAIGQQAAYQNESQYVNAFGQEAGYSNGNMATNLNALGHSAAYDNEGENVNAMGQSAAFQNTGSAINAFGDQAAWRNGYPGFTTYEVNAFGTMAAKENESHDVNFMGYEAGMSNSGAIVNGFGKYAASANSGGEVNAMGFEAAYANTGSYVNAFGNSAASGNSGSNVNAFGTSAGNANSLSGMTIFANDCMPSYTNYAAASAAITVLLGASSGCTYLYHDQATNSIGAVRL